MRHIVLPCLALVVACGDATTEPPTSSTSTSSTASTGGSGGGGTGGEGGQGGSGGVPVCGSGNNTLTGDGVIELMHDDGLGMGTLREQDWSITAYNNNVHFLNDELVHEAVRFDIEHPARIVGFKVQWAHLPEAIDPTAEFEAGLYADFGQNGFDFWAPEPLWSGTRCAEDIDDTGSTWTDYIFDEPVVLDHPGLVFVAHQALPGDPVWWFDATVEGDPMNPCAVFDDCQSAFNLPTAENDVFYNGLSFPFQFHFMVRLYVEYTDNVQPADRLFQQVANSPSAGHVSWADYDNDGFRRSVARQQAVAQQRRQHLHRCFGHRRHQRPWDERRMGRLQQRRLSRSVPPRRELH